MASTEDKGTGGTAMACNVDVTGNGPSYKMSIPKYLSDNNLGWFAMLMPLEMVLSSR
ncbi:OLC1v1006384C1 [Oldenlandia corymbosa var. corymbosa]|uniref:OLC1v1006384C1 n=1 Tax=Oldenlandia corymbosa var. corymbosa TaxID=529605 RepID=A0AAV1DJI0_OLDCO|nr:OLC1v1006384C1 [Oldenlandia corymbosa var. corymbosa]